MGRSHPGWGRVGGIHRRRQPPPCGEHIFGLLRWSSHLVLAPRTHGLRHLIRVRQSDKRGIRVCVRGHLRHPHRQSLAGGDRFINYKLAEVRRHASGVLAPPPSGSCLSAFIPRSPIHASARRGCSLARAGPGPSRRRGLPARRCPSGGGRTLGMPGVSRPLPR